VALFGDGPSRRMDGQRVPRGVGAAALASAWNRQTEDAVAVFYAPFPLMGCCHLDREGLACVALLVFRLK